MDYDWTQTSKGDNYRIHWSREHAGCDILRIDDDGKQDDYRNIRISRQVGSTYLTIEERDFYGSDADAKADRVAERLAVVAQAGMDAMTRALSTGTAAALRDLAHEAAEAGGRG